MDEDNWVYIPGRYIHSGWYNSIFHITTYRYHKRRKVPLYYRAYYLADGEFNWGDSVPSDVQEFQSLEEAKQSCYKFAKRGSTPRQRETAEKIIKRLVLEQKNV